MEQTKIDEFMRSRGFTKAIGPIFSEWEFVKDEILLPDRKEGSGNGTVHIYLLEDNMTIFRQCFSEYIEAFSKDPKESENLCPHVAHFVMTSNVLTVAGFAYMHYKCDANMFNYENFVHKVMRNDDDGMIAFESLFKFTTENRPYFKQFDKEVFSKIIRYVFVPRKTAYKIYLYSDDDFKNFATFWLIGQIPDSTFIVDTHPQTEAKAINNVKTDNQEKESQPVCTPEDVKQRFIAFIISTGLPLKTAKAYAGNVKNMIPIAQKMLDGQDHPSPFTITNIEELKSIDKALWTNEEVLKWNVEKHHRASAAFRMYIKMFQTESSGNTEVPNDSKPKLAHVMDFTLTKDEEEQKESYMKYLREERGMVPMSITNYANLLYKKLSPLIRDYYNSVFRNVYAVKDLKVLIKMDDEIWDIPEINAADESTKGKLSASFQRYRDFVESKLSDDELFSIAFGDDNEDESEEENVVKLEVGKKYQYAQYLPLYSVKAACGAFANEQEVETEGWVDVSTSGIKAKENMFVVHAKGDSMEPRIHDNDLCVFQKYEGDELENQIVLTQLITHDIDYGGMYTIKKYHAEKRQDENGYMRNSKVELLSYNPAFSPIILTEDDVDDVKTVGVFVGVLRGLSKDNSISEDTQDSIIEETSNSTKKQTIRVEYPDGKVVQNAKSKTTFLEVIKNNFPDLILGIEFSRPLISRSRLPDYPNHPRAQTLIEGGYYVSTNFSNQDKIKILKKISDELDLGLKITLVDKE
jgi:SOS-response transcriptional repressor LexA